MPEIPSQKSESNQITQGEKNKEEGTPRCLRPWDLPRIAKVSQDRQVACQFPQKKTEKSRAIKYAC